MEQWHIFFSVLFVEGKEMVDRWEKVRMRYSSDRFLLEVTETTRPPLIIIDYSHFSCMSGNHNNSD